VNRAIEIIEKITYITIATVDEGGQPWNTPVFGAYDEQYNFYWGSSRESQHSHNIKNNSKVFIVIYDSTVPAGAGEGVYIQANATELNDPSEIKTAHRHLQGRRPEPYWKLEYFNMRSPISLYRAVPSGFWMNSGKKTNGVYEDIRKEISLP
jgi:nitroimidazol reductase NimA-like FMN-containing flavoprotein (pyridoxamine 5'-phosphate oxidase superfamily)